MIPVQPEVSVRPVRQVDAGRLQPLVNGLLTNAPFSLPMDLDAVRNQILLSRPETVFPVRWVENRCLGAWRGGALIAAADVAVGFDSASLHLPEYEPVGLLRFLTLPSRDGLVPDAFDAVLAAAEAFWGSHGVRLVKAFHLSTGYRTFQAGCGLLPGDWGEHVRLLTSNEFRMTRRYYCLHRTLGQPVEETIAEGGMSLAFRGRPEDRIYELYRRATLIGRARLVQSRSLDGERINPIGLIAELYIDPQWRRHRLGRWLVTRMINDGSTLGLRQLVAFVGIDQVPAQSLLSQLGFDELHYRGYSLEKQLRA